MFAEGSSERGVAGDIIEVAEWIQGKVANCKMRAGCLGGAGTPLLSSESSSSVANWVHEEHTRLYTLDSLVPLIAVVYAMPVYMRQLLLASGTIVPCVLRRWGPLKRIYFACPMPCRLLQTVLAATSQGRLDTAMTRTCSVITHSTDTRQQAASAA